MIKPRSILIASLIFAVMIMAYPVSAEPSPQESAQARLAKADSLSNLATQYYTTSLDSLAVLYERMGSYSQAELFYKLALAIRKSVLGKNHPDYATSLNKLTAMYERMDSDEQIDPSEQELAQARLAEVHSLNKLAGQSYASTLNDLAAMYVYMGSYSQAELFYRLALATRKLVLGENHPDYATSLDKLAVSYVYMGSYDKAEPLLQQALDIRKAVFGEDHPDYVESLYSLALLYMSMGSYDKAEPLLQQALDIHKDTSGEDHPDYANSLDNLAGLYRVMGSYDKAEPLLQQTLDIRKAVFGEDHPDYANSLDNLAGLYRVMGSYDKAEPLLQQALDIHKDTSGEDHPDYANSLDNLAGLYRVMGSYDKAEPLLQQTLDIRKAVFGEDHPDYANSLDNLAGLYRVMGSYDKAEPLLQQALDIHKAVFGEDHPDYAHSLNSLAGLYRVMGSYDKAEPLLQQTLDIYKETESRSYALSLNHLANLYRAMSLYDQAEPLLQQALDIHKATTGEDDIYYAYSLNSLAGLYRVMGSYDKAEPLLQQTLDIRKAVFGKDHPDYVESLYSLALLYMSMGSYDKAEPLLQQALAISRKVLERTALVQSEKQQLAMGEMYRYQLDTYLSLALLMGDRSHTAFEQILLWKGATLVRQRQYRQAASDPAVAEVFTQLQAVTRQLASLARAYPTEKEEVANWQDQLRTLNTHRDRLEAELSRKSAVFRQAQHEVTVTEVVDALPQNAVLVDFMEFTDITQFSSLESMRPSLLASVLRPDGEVTLIDLGPQETVAQAIETWRQSFKRSEQDTETGWLLRQQVWEPLLPALGTAKTILISSDGVLGRLPFGALPGATPGKYLLEDYALAFIPVPQLLPKMSQQHQQQNDRRLLLVGGVDYDARQSEDVVAVQSAVKSDPLMVAQVRGGKYFDPLDNTLPEVTHVKRLFQQVFHPSSEAIALLSQAGATEEQFRILAPQFNFLHLATHGFFAPPKEQPSQTLTQATLAQRSIVYGDKAMVVQRADPGLLSGVVLSGANQPPQAEQDDGILTATEIAMLSLSKADLVVLSACETGLGEAAGGEGLLGVQRAFQVAGARSTVASLWKVPDEETRLLMERFYRNLWEKQMSGLEALREAQLWMLKNTEGLKSSDEMREMKDIDDSTPFSLISRTSPFYWAAFQLSGDWR